MSYKQLFTKVYHRVKNVGGKLYDAVKDVSAKVNNTFNDIERYYNRAKSLPLVGQALNALEMTPAAAQIGSTFRNLKNTARAIDTLVNDPSINNLQQVKNTYRSGVIRDRMSDGILQGRRF